MSDSRAAFLADCVAVVHGLYAATIVFGLFLIVIGGVRNWRWVRNPWFRVVHLIMILIVVIEAWLGVTCPLTTLEEGLRAQAGQPFDGDGIVAAMIHTMLFFDAPWYVFTACYTVCGLLIVVTLVLVPPKFSRTLLRE